MMIYLGSLKVSKEVSCRLVVPFVSVQGAKVEAVMKADFIRREVIILIKRVVLTVVLNLFVGGGLIVRAVAALCEQTVVLSREINEVGDGQEKVAGKQVFKRNAVMDRVNVGVNLADRMQKIKSSDRGG